MKDNSISVAIATIIFTILIAPALVFWFGWLLGWIAQFLFGAPLVTSLNMIFNTSITVEQIPWISAGISWIASYFKVIQRKEN